MGGSRRTVFASFHPDDRDWVQGVLFPALRSSGIEPLSADDLQPGAAVLDEYERIVVDLGGRVVLVISPAYVLQQQESDLELLAATYGRELGVWPVIPFVLHPTDGLRLRLRMLKPIEAFPPDRQEAAIGQLIAALGAEPPAPEERPPCPYPGLGPYTGPEHFYGREREIEAAATLLYQHPFLVVMGPSGTGKSSLVRAGLLPRLRDASRFGEGEWLFLDLEPASTPRSQLVELLGGEPTTGTVTARLQAASAARLLVFVDQFERALTGDPPEDFGTDLIALAAVPDAYVVLALRTDFYGQAVRTRSLRDPVRLHRYEVDPMDEQALAQVISEPAHDVGVYVEAALVQRLVDDAGEEAGILPFLQLTLVELWDRLQRRLLPLSAYETYLLPGSGGRTTKGLAAAIATRADAAVARLPDDAHRATARRLLVRLVQFGDNHPPIRRTQRVSQLRAVAVDEETFRATLDRLTAERILMMGGAVDDAVDAEPAEAALDPPVAIVHDSVISGWPTLREWLDASRALEDEWRRVERDARAWWELRQPEGRRARVGAWWDRVTQLYFFGRLRRATATREEFPGRIEPAVEQFLAASRGATRWAVAALGALASLLVALVVYGGFAAGDAWLERAAKRAASSERVAIAGGAAALGPNATPVVIEPFEIELDEVTVAEYRRCVERGKCSPPLAAWDPLAPPAAAGGAPDALPVTSVTASQAQGFCRWLGLDLPTWAQWERAARGVAGRLYPWGGDSPAPEHARAAFPGSAAPAAPVQVTDGSYRAGETEDGVAHLAGNVAEWTRTRAALDARTECHGSPECLEAAYEWDRRDGAASLITVGGSYVDAVEVASTGFARDAAVPLETMGFRCVKEG